VITTGAVGADAPGRAGSAGLPEAERCGGFEPAADEREAGAAALFFGGADERSLPPAAAFVARGAPFDRVAEPLSTEVRRPDRSSEKAR
jgi:hypothetical protein